MNFYHQKAHTLPPPTPALVPAETNKRPLEEQPGPSSKRSRVFITPVIRPCMAPVLITIPSTVLASPQPVIIPVFPVQIYVTPEPTEPPVQLFLPDPPPVQILLPDAPVVETL
ncbi:hypothetical protein TNCV_2560351 [Trichonephila clavipes]|uniref:Uncharacterized protein n=1 Tax=Trichonephila clavipes TaxID=2585209 RepID=A0A8X6R0K5_TRICX|nr:hypothetical protein TNCV_2560351 [Trichonephila clavipes]